MWFRSNLGNSIKLAARDTWNELSKDFEDSKQYLKDTRKTPVTTAKVAEGAVNALSFLPGVKQWSQLIKNTVKNTTKETLKNAWKNALKWAMAVESVVEPGVDMYQAAEQRQYWEFQDWVKNAPLVRNAIQNKEITWEDAAEQYNNDFWTNIQQKAWAWDRPRYENVGNAVVNTLNTAWEALSYPATIAYDVWKGIGRVFNYMSDYNKWNINRLNQPITINRWWIDYKYNPWEPLWITQQSGDEYLQQKVLQPIWDKIVNWWNRFSL